MKNFKVLLNEVLVNNEVVCADKFGADLLNLMKSIADNYKQECAEILSVLKSYDGSRAVDQWDEDLMPSRDWEKQRTEILKKFKV